MKSDRWRTCAVIFDLWNTLVPFRAPPGRRAVSEIAKTLGARRDDFAEAWSAGYAERVVGDLETSLRRACGALGLAPSDENIRRALEIRRAAHAAMFVPRTDAVPTLRRVRMLGHRTGLITNCSSEVPALWQSSPLAPLVDEAVFSCVEGLKKPDFQIYALSATRLRVKPQECVYIGDGADEELEGAASTGMHAIRLRVDDTDEPDTWDGPTIERLSDVMTLLL